MQCDGEECYRDCYAWSPDVRWGKEAMSFCPNCQSNDRVGPHVFQSNHHARHVHGVKDSCCIVSRRCICYECEKEHNTHKNELISKVSEIGLSVQGGNDDRLEDKSCTFMGYNHKSLPLLPCLYGMHFRMLNAQNWCKQ